MITVEFQAQNLRNKYENHSVIKPLIIFCNKNKLGFEFLKESIYSPYGLKSFNTTNVYYMKIGNNLLKQKREFCGWENLLDLIIHAYEYLNIEKPDNLSKVLDSYKNRVY